MWGSEKLKNGLKVPGQDCWTPEATFFPFCSILCSFSDLLSESNISESEPTADLKQHTKGIYHDYVLFLHLKSFRHRYVLFLFKLNLQRSRE